MPKYAARVDENQGEIIAALRKAGASVAVCSQVGHGFPDIAVGWNGGTYLLEIKNPAKPKRDQQLTAAQVAWRETWTGHVATVRTWQEALTAVGITHREVS